MVKRRKFVGYYGYDANGKRVYKLTGSTQYDDLNGSNPSFGIIIDGITLYPSPYIVLTEKQYTKHYYMGSEKIATMIGDGGILLETNHLSNEQRSLIKDGFCRTFEPTAFQYDKTPNIDIQGMHTYQLEYKCGCIEQVDLYLISVNSMLEPMMTMWQNSNGCKNEIYYTHGDHLGSANWITDADGNPIQYIHYAPYGELIANKQTIGYDERFKFTGKERDWETGYDYFGARFYDSRKGFWNSVDPLADKYPSNTPYMYCNGNPIMLVDPDGRYTIENIDGETDYKTILVLPSEQVLEKMPNSEKDAFICTYKQACIEKMPTIRIDNAEDFSNAMVALDGMGAYTESYILSTSHGYKLNGACALSIGSDFFTKEKSDFSQLFEGLNGKIVFITACKLAADITGVELMERFANSTGSTIIGAEHSIPATLGGFRGGSLSISPMIDAICNLFGGYYHNSFKITTGKNTNTVYGLTIDKGLGIRWCK